MHLLAFLTPDLRLESTGLGGLQRECLLILQQIPQPMDAWKVEKDVTNNRVMCPQVYQRFYFDSIQPIREDEDCLYLNVFVPLSTRPVNGFPVMVYIHGGQFQFSGKDFYPPHYLLDNDIILVTINYRLGVLGPTGDDSSAGNFGIHDQIEALKWVSINIQGFGGNAQNITIFGHDSGAISASILLVSPKSWGLFHNTMIMSGSIFTPNAVKLPDVKMALDFGEVVNCNLKYSLIDQNVQNLSQKLVNCLRTKSVDELMVANRLPGLYPNDFQFNFGPVIDSNVSMPLIGDQPINIFRAGNYWKTPLVGGLTMAEGSLDYYTHYDRIKDWKIRPVNGFPVMVYIHGGQFQFSGKDFYPPHYLLDNDIILVTINYRLGVLGPTGDDSSAGNFGIHDQIEALKWVSINIQGFGGNAQNITIFGHDSGAISASILLVSPKSWGLFHNTMIMSGSIFTPNAVKLPDVKMALDFGEVVNCNLKYSLIDQNVQNLSQKLVNCLRTKSVDELMVANRLPGLYPNDFQFNFGPVIDSNVSMPLIGDQPINIFRAGNYWKTPLVGGLTMAEGSLDYYTHYDRIKDWDDISLIDALGDFMYSSAVTLLLDLHSKVSKQTYLYVLDHQGIKTFGTIQRNSSQIIHRNQYGVTHMDDIFYLFPTLYGENTTSSYDDTVIRNMCQFFAHFAKYGRFGQNNALINYQMFGNYWVPYSPQNPNYLKYSQSNTLMMYSNDKEWQFLLDINETNSAIHMNERTVRNLSPNVKILFSLWNNTFKSNSSVNCSVDNDDGCIKPKFVNQLKDFVDGSVDGITEYRVGKHSGHLLCNPSKVNPIARNCYNTEVGYARLMRTPNKKQNNTKTMTKKFFNSDSNSSNKPGISGGQRNASYFGSDFQMNKKWQKSKDIYSERRKTTADEEASLIYKEV
ncbi:unnamed protein product [Oppiella nova]|uniref:Carboxylesterase type B domain-containing protein n=1 Tax=Oppiella nova TaxID=334625 RepID=A0A7R9QMK0_9ACAR|nr:unnamed protein product [Oppiella nova]CAG2168566.1 unnamed protein product [Oppiella nova]